MKSNSENKIHISKTLNVSVSEEGKLIAYSFLSRPNKELSLTELLVLNFFLPVVKSKAFEIYNSVAKIKK